MINDFIPKYIYFQGIPKYIYFQGEIIKKIKIKKQITFDFN